METLKCLRWSRCSFQGLEAAVGIEPTDKGFADLCLTTWLRRLEQKLN
jgi:hypothetical protein